MLAHFFLCTHLRKLRLNEDCVPSISLSQSLSFPPPPLPDSHSPPSLSPSPLAPTFQDRINRTRTPTPATLLPDDLNGILRDVDLQEEADKRLQEEKDAVSIVVKRTCRILVNKFVK